MTSPASAEPRRRRWRILGLCIGLAALAVAYMAGFADLYQRPEAGERTVGDQDAVADSLRVYVEVAGVDPVRQSIPLRLDFSIRRGPAGPHYPAAPSRDMTVQASDGAYVLDIELPAGRPAPTTSTQVGVQGSIGAYPFDVYTGQLSIAAWEGLRQEGVRIPVIITFWEHIGAWEVSIAQRPAQPGEAGLTLAIEARRPLSHVFFAIVVYVVMTIIALCGLTIGTLAFIGARKIEAAFTGGLAAMLFAVPALRNAMPGAPPLGVAADAFVFLWVQVALMLGLALFVVAWAQRGPPP